MGKIDFNPDEEIVITEGGLLMIVEGIAEMGVNLGKVSEKLDEQDFKNLMIPLLATFVATARLFPPKNRKQIFAELEKVGGFNPENLV